jgi:hypothetical protein
MKFCEVEVTNFENPDLAKFGCNAAMLLTTVSYVRNDRPSAAPSKPSGPAFKPLPVVIFVTKDHPNTAATTKYEIPSAAPSSPKNPAGKPDPVVFKT